MTLKTKTKFTIQSRQRKTPNFGIVRFNGKLSLLTHSLNLPQNLEFLDLTKKIFAQIGW